MKIDAQNFRIARAEKSDFTAVRMYDVNPWLI